MNVLQDDSCHWHGQARGQQMAHFRDHDQLRPRDRCRQGDAVLYGKTGIVLAVDNKSWHLDLTKPLRAAGCANSRQNVVDRSQRGLCPRP